MTNCPLFFLGRGAIGLWSLYFPGKMDLMNKFKSLKILILLQGMEFAQEPAKDFSFRRLSDVEGRLEVIRHYSASYIYSSKGKTYENILRISQFSSYRAIKINFCRTCIILSAKVKKLLSFNIRICHVVVVKEYIEAGSLLSFWIYKNKRREFAWSYHNIFF